MNLRRAHGILDFSYSDPRTERYIERSYAIAYEDDPTCLVNPLINQLIERALAPFDKPKTGHRPATRCEPKPPRYLLDGSLAGAGRLVDSTTNMYVWGRGEQEVQQFVGGDPLELIGTEEAAQVQGPRWTSYLINIGDPGTGSTAFAFSVGGCDYTVWLPAGTTMKRAMEFAS